MRQALLIVFCLEAASARADVLVYGATLRDGDANVGALDSAQAAIVAWETPTRLRIRFDHPSILLEAAIDLRESHAVVGVEAGTLLERTGGFAIRTAPGATAPLLGRTDGDQVRIALPPGLPVRSARIDRSALVTPPRTHRAFAQATASEHDYDNLCRPLAIRAWPNGGPSATLPVGAWVRTDVRRRPHEVEVWADGFVLRGFTERAPTACHGCSYAAPATTRACRRSAPRRAYAGRLGARLIAGRAFAELRVETPLAAVLSRYAVCGEHEGTSWAFEGALDRTPDSASPREAVVCETMLQDWPRRRMSRRDPRER